MRLNKNESKTETILSYFMVGLLVLAIAYIGIHIFII